MTASPNWILLNTVSYEYLADALVRSSAGKIAKAVLTREIFPDGERYLRLEDQIAGGNVAILGGTVSDSDTVEMFDLACLAVRYQAHSIRLMFPYFGYQTMERPVRFGEDVKAKNRAVLFSYLPKPPGGLSALALDLHQEGIPEYFENGVNCKHVYSEPLTLKLIEKENGNGNVVLGCTDAGRAKWVSSLAKRLNLPVAIVLKERLSMSETKQLAVHAEVTGRHVIIFDDMIRTGGSLIAAARSYKDKGASKITAMVTHGVLPGQSLGLLRDAQDADGNRLFSKLFVTDSHPNAVRLIAEQKDDFMTVESVADLIWSELSAFTR